MAVPDPAIRLRTLGSLQLCDADGAEARTLLAQPRRVALLVYLVVATPRGFHRRDRLLALFWPDHDEARARNALSQAVHFLRRALGADVIHSRGDDEIAANGGQVWCDALALDAALAADRPDEVVELYRGPFLDAVRIPSAAAELDQWVDAERRRLGQSYARALARLADAREAAHDHAGAAVWLRKLAAHDPFDAPSTLRLMRALAATGDHAGAIRHARVHETLLREELGAPADPGITALAHSLQESSPNAPASAPPALPVPPAPASGDAAPPGRPMRAREPRRVALAAIAAGALVILGALGAVALVRARERAVVTPQIRCLAVIPLENLSRDSSQEYVADGLTDALITELARHERLTVISRTSITRYKRTSKSLPTIGRELDCDGVIEGTVSIAGPRVHVNAQLLYAPGDRHLWAMGYDGDLGDVLSLERQIADSIASQVHVVTSARDRAPSTPVDLIAYGQYLRGRDAFRSRNPAALRQAIALFRQAIARDSTFALGYAGLADAYRLLGGLGYAPRAPAADSARAMATRAIALDSNLAAGYTALAALLTDDADWTRAEAGFQRAITLEPSNALAHQWYAAMLATEGRNAEALREIGRAAELDPLSQSVRGAKVDIERAAGVRDTTRVLTDRSTLVDPNNAGTIAMLSVNLARRGRCDEAYTENRRAQELAPGNTPMLISLVGVHELCGRSRDARALLDSIERRPDAATTGELIAELFARDAPDSAFAWLARTDWGMASRFALRTSVRLDPIRSDPRYARLLASMGLH